MDQERNGLLVRVGIDKTYGKWNSPANSMTNEYVYVPIWEEEGKDEKSLIQKRPYAEYSIALKKFGSELPKRLEKRHMHLDPDFDYCTYGDCKQRGKIIKKLKPNDFLVFYASFSDLTGREHRLIYALFGIYFIEEIKPVNEVPDTLKHMNAHTRRTSEKNIPDNIVVFANKEISGRFNRLVPVGEYRIDQDGKNGTYRVKKEILDEWGGLKIKDGYIQRSVYLPMFSDPERFLVWYNKQKNPFPLCKNNYNK